MAARFRTKDRVLETSVTTGAGTYTLAGAATGFQAFVGGSVAASDLVPYYAEDGTNWEAGIGTVLSGPARLERTTVLSSSNGGAAVNWGAGTRNLRCGWPAELNTPRYKSVSIAGAAGTQVLTQDEQRCDILNLTGALTGNRVIEVDTTPWEWIVVNGTTGAFGVTLKVTGLTGAEIAQGRSKLLHCNGTDVAETITDVAGAAATQAEQEAATSLAAAVTPGRQQYHPSAAKGWVRFDNAVNIAPSYNVTSVTDNGVGSWTINWNVDFSSTVHCDVATLEKNVSSAATTLVVQITDSGIAAGTTTLNVVDTTAVTARDPTYIHCIAFGDQ